MGLFKKKGSENHLIKLLPVVEGEYFPNEVLAQYTWFNVGGPAEVMYSPKNTKDLCYFMKNKPYNLPIFVIGGGSNLLVRDGGIPGVVVKLKNKSFRSWKIDGDKIICGAGMKNTNLKKIMIDNNLGGLEFLVSIPGELGGAVRTNAGCFGKELKDVLVSATIVNAEGEELEVDVDDFNLSYRRSFFPEEWIITSMTLRVFPQDSEITKNIIEGHKSYRMKNQPYNAKTAGSTFKNPEGLRAWELIKKTKSNELKVNDAEVSDKHCNFLINKGNATAQDIENLGNKIIERVKEETSIVLEWEVKRVGINK
jgi:UDP-N-acetylmuramate dehydrogenase